MPMIFNAHSQFCPRKRCPRGNEENQALSKVKSEKPSLHTPSRLTSLEIQSFGIKEQIVTMFDQLLEQKDGMYTKKRHPVH